MNWGKHDLSHISLVVAVLATIGLAVSLVKLHLANTYVQALNSRLDGFKPAAGHEHSDIRQWMIRQELTRVGPIIVLGDSLTEAAPLPATICGRAVVNAGVGGANTKFGLDNARSLFSNVTPALIVIALGTNDAHVMPDRLETFTTTYRALLDVTGNIAARTAIATIPSIEPGDVSRGGAFDASLIPEFNRELERLARDLGIELIDVRAAIDKVLPNRSTIDGVHLTNRAYDIWLPTLQSGIRKVMGCGEVANTALQAN